jgi:hypothetical protein
MGATCEGWLVGMGRRDVFFKTSSNVSTIMLAVLRVEVLD